MIFNKNSCGFGKGGFDNSFIKTKQLFRLPQLEKVSFFICDYDVDHFGTELYRGMRIPFPSTLNGAVKKRQAEYLAGRLAARHVLRSIGVEASEIASGGNRVPIWPLGIVASISHTKNSALCGAAKKHDHNYLGVDIEPYMNSRLAAQLKYSIINKEEEEILSQYDMPFEHLLTLVFSAKESVYKALYPYVKEYFGFNAVRLAAINTKSSAINLTLGRDLAPEIISGTNVKGIYINMNDHLMTVVCGSELKGKPTTSFKI